MSKNLMIPTSTEGMSPEVMELMQSQAADMTETGGGDLMPEIGKRALQIGKKAVKQIPGKLNMINSLTGGSSKPLGLGSGIGEEGSHYIKDSKGQPLVRNPETRLKNLVHWGEGGLMKSNDGTHPLVFFHASPEFIGNEFDMTKSQARDGGWLAQGAYVTTRHKMETLDQYTRWLGKEGNAAEVIPLFIKIKKPLELFRDPSEVGWGSYKMFPEDRNIIQNKLINMKIDFENITDPNEISLTMKEEADSLNLIENFRPEHIETYLEKTGKDMSVTDFLQSSGLGYDGIIMREPGNPDDIPEAVIFKPTQAKSVFNRGFFNPDSADLHSQTEKKDPQTYS